MISLLDADTLIFMIRGLKSSNRHQTGKPAGTQNVRIERHEECTVPVDGHAERTARECSAAARGGKVFSWAEVTASLQST